MKQKEEINIQPEQNEETRILKNEERLRNCWDNFKRSIIPIMGLPVGEDKEQDIGNLSEKTVKENFSNLVKEIDMQVQEARESQTRWMQRGHSKTHHN